MPIIAVGLNANKGAGTWCGRVFMTGGHDATGEASGEFDEKMAALQVCVG